MIINYLKVVFFILN